MKSYPGSMVVVAALLSCGCIAISSYYVPVDFDSESSDRICLEKRPYYTIELYEGVQVSVRTLHSGSMAYIYVVVGLEQESSLSVAAMHAHIQLSGTGPVRVELVRQTWQSDDYETRYGENYLYFTIGTRLIAGEEKFTLHLPNLVAFGKELVVDPIVFEKRSQIGIDVCPSGMAW